MKRIVFLGDSKQIISDFPDSAKRAIGYALGQVQDGEEPKDWNWRERNPR